MHAVSLRTPFSPVTPGPLDETAAAPTDPRVGYGR